MAKSAVAQRLLEQMSPDQLEAYYALSSSEEWDEIKESFENWSYNIMASHSKTPSSDPQYLVEKHGEVRGMLLVIRTLTEAIENAGPEIDKRESRRKRKQRATS